MSPAAPHPAVGEPARPSARGSVRPAPRIILASLAASGLASWLLLPLALPRFRVYTAAEAIECLFWQVAGLAGWPLALVGGLAGTLSGSARTDLAELALLLPYPAMTLLAVCLIIPRRRSFWVLLLLHVLLAFSFGAVWYRVLNGYDFGGG